MTVRAHEFTDSSGETWRVPSERVGQHVLRPGDAAWRALALDVLRIEEGIIMEIVTFASPLFPRFGLPLTIDEQAGGERRPRISQ